MYADSTLFSQEAERVISEQPPVPHVRFYDPSLKEDLEGAAGAQKCMCQFALFYCLFVC